MKIAVYTRSRNAMLWRRMRGFIAPGIALHQATGFNRWEDSAAYLYWLLNHAQQNGVDIALNVDEDCFITHWPVVMQLVAYVQANNITHAGMPDGGVVPHRTNSWAVQNPFFNVFNVALCNAIIAQSSVEAIDAFTFADVQNRVEPTHLPYAVNHNNDEPFTGFFYYLHTHGKPLGIDATTWPDGITTNLLFNNTAFCTHTWYSRNYGNNNYHTNRINTIYKHCKALAGN